TVFISLGIIAQLTHMTSTNESATNFLLKKPKFGALKLCPPGGRSFFEAFQLACPMRRKRDISLNKRIPRLQRKYRPATLSEIMKICCLRGCEFSDFFPHCGPFSEWH
uniref:Insulin-like domain-containing protein n=1 Tax=Parascaris univalens TaxID=6257 RepID=A0A915BTZ3_PARUN